MNREL